VKTLSVSLQKSHEDGFAIMAAKLATVDEHILAYAEGSGAIPDGSGSPSRANEQPPFDGIQFDCGYLSPFFITDPERMEVAFEKRSHSRLPRQNQFQERRAPVT
jgi:hypothetical protein